MDVDLLVSSLIFRIYPLSEFRAYKVALHSEKKAKALAISCRQLIGVRPGVCFTGPTLMIGNRRAGARVFRRTPCTCPGAAPFAQRVAPERVAEFLRDHHFEHRRAAVGLVLHRLLQRRTTSASLSP